MFRDLNGGFAVVVSSVRVGPALEARAHHVRVCGALPTRPDHRIMDRPPALYTHKQRVGRSGSKRCLPLLHADLHLPIPPRPPVLDRWLSSLPLLFCLDSQQRGKHCGENKHPPTSRTSASDSSLMGSVPSGAASTSMRMSFTLPLYEACVNGLNLRKTR